MVRRSEEQPDDLVSWLFFAVLRRKTTTAKCHGRQVRLASLRGQNDITKSNICQLNNEALVHRFIQLMQLDVPSALSRRRPGSTFAVGTGFRRCSGFDMSDDASLPDESCE